MSSSCTIFLLVLGQIFLWPKDVRKSPVELSPSLFHVLSPCYLVLAVSHISLLTRHLSPLPHRLSPLPGCRSFLHHHPSSPFPSLVVSHLLKRNWSPPYLDLGCSQRRICVIRSFTSTLLLTSQPCTLQVYCDSSIPLASSFPWSCFYKLPGCKSVVFVRLLTAVCRFFPIFIMDFGNMKIVLSLLWH